MPKTILITAGNTSEPIDDVRTITNTATGTLGSKIADLFIENGFNVVYICGKNSKTPEFKTIETVTILGVYELKEAIENLSKKYTFDCIIHSMAVSDYTVKSVLSYDELKENILDGKNLEEKPVLGKLSSEMENPVILLQKAPKVISFLRALQPKALIVGFKLLVGVSEEKLYETALNLMKKNDCDFVLANDLKNISNNSHLALLISKDKTYKKLPTKEKIAEEIFNAITEKWRNS